MTNAMNVLIEGSNSEKQDGSSNQGNRTIKIDNFNTRQSKKNWIRYTFLSFLITYCLFFYFMYQSQTGRKKTELGKALYSSWIREGYRPIISDALLYTPEQLHLSLGTNDTEVYLTWSTIEEVDKTELVYQQVNWLGSGNLNIVEGSKFAREVVESDPKWRHVTRHKTRVLYTYRAKLSGLKPGSLYIYTVMTHQNCVTYYSKTYHYSPRNLSDSHKSVKLALFGDLGLINGQSVPRLIRDVDNDEYDVIIHNGDFAYDLNTHLGQYGDEFMRKIEPIAARVPYQTSVGNHEIAENFTHYDHRFTMINSGGISVGQQNNFFYSFNAGPIHFIAFSTEFYYFLDSVGIESLHNQYEWLKEDLSRASSPSERDKRPWIIVFGHRPMYCSSRDRDDCSKDSNILRKGLPFVGGYALEKLFYDYGVDVQLYSHEHQYERFLPIYDGQVYNGTDNLDDPYENPLAPVHLISGSAGCQERLDPFNGKSAPGSVVKISDYGYTRLLASRCKLIFRQISDDQSGSIVDEFVISKTRQNFPSKSNKTIDCTMDEGYTFSSSEASR